MDTTSPTPGTGGPTPPFSPEAFARLVDLAEDAIVSVDADQRIVLFNRGAERTFGYLTDEVVGRQLDLLIPARFGEVHRLHMRAFAATPVDARVMGERRPVHGRRKDGTEFPAEVTISKFREGGRLFFNAILRDVTERQRAEDAIRALNQELEARVKARTAELEEANRQLARKNEENEAFVYSVSHDLRAPLVNLEGFSKELALACQDVKRLLTDPGLPPAVRDRAEAVFGQDVAESMTFIHAAVARLSGIIDALLRLSRAGRVQYEPKLVALGPIVDRVVQSLRATAERKGVTVTVGDLPDAWADPAAAEQVFANLIENALNYLDPARPGRVEVGSVPGEPGVRTYFVRDNGLGIPAAYQAQMFQAFRRLHADLAPGEGMGLVTIRRVLDRLGGRIWFESDEGVGTMFYFTLPTGTPAAPDTDAP
jgi:PAS domain S-box-containing protein